MHLSVAKALIEKGVNQHSIPQVWADLGAGDGLFTQALSEVIPPKSKILAVDKDKSAIAKIRINPGVTLEQVHSEFETLDKLPALDGVLMANSLHYVREQINFLKNLRDRQLKPNGVLVLIEYNLTQPNRWVPYPIDLARLADLAHDAGFLTPTVLHRVPSRLNASEIYSALLKQ
jgi:trans-aconitate methyltransferase